MSDSTYRVLARKYRPKSFSEMIGQDAVVRTLTNAFETGRIAHAYVLTGTRGIGKTTTARIIARALNCESGPTAHPCGTCPQCRDIGEERHIDVIEMDAASRTGVDDVRELIQSVPYAPTQGRYKIYIIDEAHMLSKSAWNALLKTLEEPPEHTKFVFATTEARKIPATILSRCQRFDLRRVEPETLRRHFAAIAEKEGVRIDAEALALVARAADGSIRDGLSILDQAIGATKGDVTGAALRGMLGLADRSATIEAIDAALAGNAGAALAGLRAAIDAGADPATVLRDMLEYAHFVAVVAAFPGEAKDPDAPDIDRRLAPARAKALGVQNAHQAWTLLLKGLGDTLAAPDPRQAAEMTVLRVAAQFAPAS